MDNKERKKIEQNMVKLSNNMEKRLEKNGQEIETIGYFKDFEFKGSGLGVNDAYIVKLKDAETKSKKRKAKSKESDDQLEKNIYEIYDKDNNLIATVDEQGNLKFDPEFIESLKEINEALFNTLTLEDAKFELPKEIEKDDFVLTKAEIEELANEMKLEEVSKISKSKKIDSYSEIDTKKAIQFDRMNSMQEIDPYAKVTGTETLADMVPEIKEKGITKLGVVYSNASKGQAGRFSFVGVDKNGKVQNINSLESVQGVTTGQTVTSINSRDGSKVEQEQVAGMVRLGNRGTTNGQEELLSLKIGQYGILEVDYVRADLSKDKNERYLSAPVETQSVKPSTKEVRDFMDKSKNTEIDDELDKSKPELKKKKKTEMRNMDDTASNDLLGPDDIIVLENGKKTTLRKEAGKAKISPEEFTRRYNLRGGKTPDEKIDAIQDEVEEEFGAPKRNR